MSDPEMDEAIKEFVIESDENISAVERDLVDFEGNPEQQATLASIFRAVHTIKDTCSFLGYSKLESLAHTGEALLSLVRDGDLAFSHDIASALLTMVDAVRQMLASIEQTGTDGTEDYPELKNLLVALQKGEASPTVPETSESVAKNPPESHDVKDNQETALVEPNQQSETGPLSQEASPPLLTSLLQQGSETPKPESPVPVGETRGPSAAEFSIRVDVGLLDKLMNMVGELVLTRNQINQGLARSEDSSLLHAAQQLRLFTTELQEGIMKTRMQQIGDVWSEFPRVVRDLAMSCGKEIRIDMDGKETELDKTLEIVVKPLGKQWGRCFVGSAIM